MAFTPSPEIARMYGGTPPLPPASRGRSQEWYDRFIAQDQAWIIDVDGAMAGCIFLHSMSETDRNARLAMGLFGEDLLGRGIGRKALTLALDQCFGPLNLHRVELRVLAYNTRAVRCYEACGFKHEGRLRDNAWIDGRWEDDLIMARLASDPAP